MFARMPLVSTAAVAVCFALTSCGSKTAPVPAPRVGVVVDASDGAGAAAAVAGLTACKRRADVQLTALTAKSAGDDEPKLVLLATENFDAVIAIGEQRTRDVAVAARRFGATHFAIVGGIVDEPNVDSITFKSEDGAFLAGALAAMVSKTKSVALVSAPGAALDGSEAGFTAGAREVDPRVVVRERRVASSDDVRGAKALTDGLLADGSDVLYVAAGGASSGAIDAANGRRNARLIVDAGAAPTAAVRGNVLASVVRRIDTAANRVCREAVAQKPVSGHVQLGIVDDGIALAPSAIAKRSFAGALARLERLRLAIVAGTIVPPATRTALATFKPRRFP